MIEVSELGVSVEDLITILVQNLISGKFSLITFHTRAGPLDMRRKLLSWCGADCTCV